MRRDDKHRSVADAEILADAISAGEGMVERNDLSTKDQIASGKAIEQSRAEFMIVGTPAIPR